MPGQHWYHGNEALVMVTFSAKNVQILFQNALIIYFNCIL